MNDDNGPVKPQQGRGLMTEASQPTGQVGGQAGYVKGGVYRHPETGAEEIMLDDPITGDAKARAAIRVGYEWVREAKPEDIHEVGMPPSEVHANSPERRLEALEAEIRELRAAKHASEAADARAAEAASKQTGTTEQAQAEAQAAAQARSAAENQPELAAAAAPETPETETKEKGKK